MLEQVVQCDLIHFAGHGVSDHVDPFQSGLILQEGKGAVKKTDKLTVQQIEDCIPVGMFNAEHLVGREG